MSSKIANENGTLEFSNITGPPDLVSTGDIGIDSQGITTLFATKAKAGGGRVAVTSSTALFTSLAVCPHSSSHSFTGGGGVLLAGSVKCRAEGQPVILEGDQSVAGCAGIWLSPSYPYDPVFCTCTMRVKTAGQDKAKGL